MYEDIPDLNIFMMCEKLNRHALIEIPPDFHVRSCKKDEFDIWLSFPFDTQDEALQYHDYMLKYFKLVYSKKEELFYSKCLFICDKNDIPVATCFLWKSYDEFNTIHWFKTLKNYEGVGIGRALLSFIMKDLKEDDFPVYLHTQPSSFKAIKLYSDFGFKILTDGKYGNRKNDYKECLPILKKYMTLKSFRLLEFSPAPAHFIKVTNSASIDEF